MQAVDLPVQFGSTFIGSIPIDGKLSSLRASGQVIVEVTREQAVQVLGRFLPLVDGVAAVGVNATKDACQTPEGNTSRDANPGRGMQRGAMRNFGISARNQSWEKSRQRPHRWASQSLQTITSDTPLRALPACVNTMRTLPAFTVGKRTSLN